MRRSSLLLSFAILTAATPLLAQGAPPVDEADRIRQEAEKKAEAIRKAAEEKARKIEEAAKRKAEREAEKARAKQEREDKRQREKEAKERTKAAAEPPPPPESPAEAPEPEPPALAAPPPAAPPPPPPTRPQPTPVEGIAAARWTSIGLVESSSVDTLVPDQDAAAGKPVAVPQVVDEAGRTMGYIRLGLGRARFNPVNDDRTDDETAFGLFEFDVGGGVEFRRAGALLVPWLDFDMGQMFGKRRETDASGSETGRVFEVYANRLSGLFGLGLQPIDYLYVGPHLGYRLELYSVSLAQEESSEPSDSGLNNGLQYGVHLRVRTKSTFEKPALLLGEARYEWRQGEYQTAQYVVLQANVHVGFAYLSGWYESRLGSSGSFAPSDVEDLGEASAAAIPIDQRLGVGLSVTFY